MTGIPSELRKPVAELNEDQHSRLKEYQREWYQKNKHRQRERANTRVASYRKRNQDWMLNHLIHNPCMDCGETNTIVLQCDHHSDDKEYNPGDVITRGGPLQRLIDEVAKCDIVCANCHVIRTQTRVNSYRVKYENGEYEFTT